MQFKIWASIAKKAIRTVVWAIQQIHVSHV